MSNTRSITQILAGGAKGAAVGTFITALATEYPKYEAARDIRDHTTMVACKDTCVGVVDGKYIDAATDIFTIRLALMLGMAALGFFVGVIIASGKLPNVSPVLNRLSSFCGNLFRPTPTVDAQQRLLDQDPEDEFAFKRVAKN